MQKYIKEQCGIQITLDRAYLIESRLSKLLSELGLRNYFELYRMVCADRVVGEVVEKVIDEITTNETQWFRDKTSWKIIENVLLPVYIKEIRGQNRTKVRIWSAACSTGQEPYSTAMCIDNYLYRNKINDIKLAHFEILATDISQAALQVAKTGKYDSISVQRGMDDTYKLRYLKQLNRTWIIDEKIKNAVQFHQFNLLKSFLLLGNFDVILCRYVTIYFFEELKKEVLRKMASALNSGGVLFLGNSEIFSDYKENFLMEEYMGGVYYRVKRTQGD